MNEEDKDKVGDEIDENMIVDKMAKVIKLLATPRAMKKRRNNIFQNC